MQKYSKIAQLKTVDAFRKRLAELDLHLEVDDDILVGDASPMSQEITLGPLRVGNRWCIHPMEGWDANPDGSPSEHTLRRWENFGKSGAKLIWGGEAAAVREDGRANPNQTMGTVQNRQGLSTLLQTALEAHRKSFGRIDDLVVGLQLTHSGRFCRPNDKRLEPRIAYHHELLDAKYGIDSQDDSVVWTDDDLHRLIDCYVASAKVAQEVGFQFVDVKACHGYLLHEFLSARHRVGPFGGDLDGRSNLLKTIIGRIQNEVPSLMVLVRISIFDTIPFQTSRTVGQPMPFDSTKRYELGFGVDETNPVEMDLTEPIELLRQLAAMGVSAFNISCGSPYYNPHIQRPAIFPPSDGYLPPEDPLVGVHRQIQATRQCKEALPNTPIVGTGYSYLQEYLPHVAQAAVHNWVDLVGLGRMVLSYPELPRDTLESGTMIRQKICRTFSDCTTAPRHGIISGCFPLDPYYRKLDVSGELKQIKKQISGNADPVSDLSDTD